jgi:hypothetical protein
MNLTLYELTEVARQELAQLSELDMDEQTIRDTMESIQWPVEQKAQNVLAVAGNLEAEADLIEQRMAVLAKRQKSLASRSKWLKDYVLGAMQAAGIKEIKCADFVARPRMNPERVVIDNEAGLPDECWRTIPATRELDKASIKELLKAGNEQVSQAAHLERSVRLEVK